MSQADNFTSAVEALVAGQPNVLTPLGASLLVAGFGDVANDTRQFARLFDIAHALVLRECVALASEHQFLNLEDRRDRSQRLFFRLTEKGHTLVQEALQGLDQAMSDG